VDDDCDGADLTDVDGDGYDAEEVGGGDCDDEDSAINPGAEEIAYDGVDDDCDGYDLTDVDGDGYDAEEVGGEDCDDEDASVSASLPEQCDDIDNDCDGDVNEDWWDAYDASTGEDNDELSDVSDIGEVDDTWFWEGTSVVLEDLTIHVDGDEDWYYFDVNDEWWDDADLSVYLYDLDASADWVLELWDLNGTPTLSASTSGYGTLSLSRDGDWLDDGEDYWAVRVYTTSWPDEGLCELPYTLEFVSD
jgi:hypothetical protein